MHTRFHQIGMELLDARAAHDLPRAATLKRQLDKASDALTDLLHRVQEQASARLTPATDRP